MAVILSLRPARVLCPGTEVILREWIGTVLQLYLFLEGLLGY